MFRFYSFFTFSLNVRFNLFEREKERGNKEEEIQHTIYMAIKYTQIEDTTKHKAMYNIIRKKKFQDFGEQREREKGRMQKIFLEEIFPKENTLDIYN